MARTNKKVAVKSTAYTVSYTPSVLHTADIINLPLVPRLLRARKYYPEVIIPTVVELPKKKLIQAKVPVVADGRSYPSICAMMKGEGIQDRAKEGLDNNWSQIRAGLKKTGCKVWNFADGRTLVISQ